MSIIDSMKQKLSVFSIYDLENSNSLILAELKAYAKGLEYLKESLNEREAKKHD